MMRIFCINSVINSHYKPYCGNILVCTYFRKIFLRGKSKGGPTHFLICKEASHLCKVHIAASPKHNIENY